jgi:hypothetical protein
MELGHRVEPAPVRTTEFAPALAEAKEQQPLPPCSAWRRPDSVLTTEGIFLPGQDVLSEGCLMPSFPDWFSILLLCCQFRSSSRRFDRLW